MDTCVGLPHDKGNGDISLKQDQERQSGFKGQKEGCPGSHSPCKMTCGSERWCSCPAQTRPLGCTISFSAFSWFCLATWVFSHEMPPDSVDQSAKRQAISTVPSLLDVTDWGLVPAPLHVPPTPVPSFLCWNSNALLWWCREVRIWKMIGLWGWASWMGLVPL